MSWEFWPQYLMVALYACHIGKSLMEYAGKRESVIDVLSTLIGVGISVFVLYSGGFFG